MVSVFPAASSTSARGLFHNAKEQIARGAGPFYYLPKMESHLEARLWNDIFVMAQEHIGMPQGTIKATVLVETILATFEMEEILYELRNHPAGLNAGRWDYIFSVHQEVQEEQDFCLAQRGAITMEVPFMRSYALALVQACHKRGAPAMGGMSALIPIKNDPVPTRRRWPASATTRPATPTTASTAAGSPTWPRRHRPRRIRQGAGRPPQPVGQAGFRQLWPEGLAQLPARAADHRSRPAQQHQRRHPLPRQLARRQRLRADPQPDGRCGHRRNLPPAGVAVGHLAEGRARRRPQGHRRNGPPDDCRGAGQGKGTVTAQGETPATYDQAAVIFDKMSLTLEYPGS